MFVFLSFYRIMLTRYDGAMLSSLTSKLALRIAPFKPELLSNGPLTLFLSSHSLYNELKDPKA